MKTDVFAKEIRVQALKMVHAGRSSHIGSILSEADILAVLFSEVLNIDPRDPMNPNRDRFILSKGHAGAGIYAALALRGFFDKAELLKHYSNGSHFSGHVSHKGIAGVEFSTGSLGHGLSVGVGMALAAKKKMAGHKIFVLLSDGEMNEGSNWEALMAASHFRLNNLISIIDYNKLQSLASTEETMGLEPLVDKIAAFGWEVTCVDGHCHTELRDVFTKERVLPDTPHMIIANTIKGKGVSFMENKVLWHYAPPNDDELEIALEELRGSN